MLTAAPYEQSMSRAWDELVSRAPMGTMLHTRAFLGYHGERFEDASLALLDGDRLMGVLPAARGGEGLVVSHPGATFAGLVHDGCLGGPANLEAMGSVVQHYASRGFDRLRYAPVPHIYHRRPSEDDLYALFRFGAERVRCDLSCAVDLEVGARPSSRRRRGQSKARRQGVEVLEGPELVEELWPVVEANLAERHGARPVHDAGEMRLLVDLFPERITVVVARLAEEPVAGVVLFEGDRVSHAQYIASVGAGQAAGALDLVFDHCLTRAAARGVRFFDFGTSNREEGRVLNEGLYEFKAEFGGGGVAYEQYELDLTAGR